MWFEVGAISFGNTRGIKVDEQVSNSNNLFYFIFLEFLCIHEIWLISKLKVKLKMKKITFGFIPRKLHGYIFKRWMNDGTAVNRRYHFICKWKWTSSFCAICMKKMTFIGNDFLFESIFIQPEFMSEFMFKTV